ncbi:hypothetical protein O2N63_17440 [Aliiroseovarius sp. KMU-50]|uniref:DUF2946 domain-containing protein n=1 Tax=Aliiroseovarius salicola TaxID=3009082 RepID=A0ABT4W5S3_9RHOB|nr:hypothetical protein [Aliiroseovarius sp. KMU-50]MDA5095877.1 hypothetical protein [Aliiroseovarius sp. KMU-50]
MKELIFASLFRLIAIVIFGGLIGGAGFPDTAEAHAATPWEPGIASGEVQAVTHPSAADIETGHCHPGLDCFTVAALPFSANLPGVPSVGKSRIRFAALEPDGWIPTFDIPPPRKIILVPKLKKSRHIED